MDDKGNCQRKQIDEEGRIIFWTQFVALSYNPNNIDKHGSDHESHKQGMPNAANKFGFVRNIVQEGRELGNQEQNEVNALYNNNSAENTALLPFFACADVQ